MKKLGLKCYKCHKSGVFGEICLINNSLESQSCHLVNPTIQDPPISLKIYNENTPNNIFNECLYK